jgi:hypothetical protein
MLVLLGGGLAHAQDSADMTRYGSAVLDRADVPSAETKRAGSIGSGKPSQRPPVVSARSRTRVAMSSNSAMASHSEGTTLTLPYFYCLRA